MTPWTFLTPYLKHGKFAFIAVFLCLFGGETARQSTLYFSSQLIGVLSDSNDKAKLLTPALWLIWLIFFFSVLRAFTVNWLPRYIEKQTLPPLNTRIAMRLFDQAHRHSLQFFNEEMSGRIAGKSAATISGIDDLYEKMKVPFMFLCRMVIALAFLIWVNIWVALSVSICLALYLKISFKTSQRVSQCSAVASNKKSVATGVLVDTLFNATLIKNDGHMGGERFHMWDTLRPKIRAEQEVYKAETRMYVVQGIFRGILQIIGLSIPFFFWMYDMINLTDFVLAESLLTYLIAFGLNFAGPCARTMKSWGVVKDGLSFLYQPFTVVDKSNAARLNISTATILFQDVTFFYPPTGKVTTSPVLFNHFNLEIKAGEKVGLVGSSGSGKSSLIKLLNRYYDIGGGAITINKINIADVTQASLHQHIALIPQDPALFNRTIMENIRYGNPDASDAAVIRAAKQAYCHDFIMRLPNGYQSRVGERGIMLSGGERQRIAIARAIIKNAPILILDEATSALDSESEILIQKALQGLMKNKTVVAIAHRLSTLKEMDRLIVMQDGEIIESGTGEQLLRQNGAYATFYNLQAKSFQEVR